MHGAYADGVEIQNSDESDIEKNELYRLMAYVMENREWGSTKWACWKRNEQPQEPVADKMKEGRSVG